MGSESNAWSYTHSPKIPKNIAFRDVLLIGFTHAPNLQSPTGNTLFDYKEIKENINPPVLLEQVN